MLDKSTDECFYGSVTVGERGQVVLPADMRKTMNIAPGDRLLAFRHPMGKGVILTKLDDVQDVIAMFQQAVASLGAEADGTKQENS